MEEIWKPVVGYEGLYEVSNLGRVRSVDRLVNHPSGSKSLRKSKLLSPNMTRGYLCVHLSKNCKVTSQRVHRLVAEAFIPNPYNLPMINHKNEVKSDNSIDNLEWCDCNYNINYGTSIKRMINTKVERGIYDKTHIGLPRKEQNKLNQRKYVIRKKQGI